MKLDREIFKASIILLLVFNSYSLLNFIFQSSMARLLSVADYGILASLMYFVYFMSIFSESIQTIIMKYSSGERDLGKVKNILKRSFRKAIYPTIILLILYSIVILPISYFASIPYSLILINGLIISVSLFLPIVRGVMQGKKRFYQLGFNMLSESIFKIIASVILVFIGWRVYGAVIGIFIGFLIALFLSLFQIKDILIIKESVAKVKDIYSYSKPVFILTFSILSFYTADILIAQIVFSKELAGYYSIASILSKIIFWGTQPISRAMFPLSAEQASKSKDTSRTYSNSIIFVSIGVFLSLLAFYFFPDLIVKLFSGKELTASAQILFYLGLSTSLLSFANLNILYKVSVGKYKNYISFLTIPIVGIILLLSFNSSLFEFSIAFLAASALFLWGSIFILK